MTDRPTLANWREAPMNRTSFQRVREIVPTAAIRTGRAQPLPRGRTVETLGALAVPAPGGGETTWAGLVVAGETDACMVLHRGSVVWEWHAAHFDRGLPHLVFSVTKSVTGVLAGCLAAEGRLDPEAPVTALVPEVTGSAYDGARVRDLLDMTVATGFEEVYDDPQSDYMRYRVATGWNPPRRAGETGDLLSFLATMPKREGPHGERFHYISPNSDLLGIVLERASGERWSDMVSRRLWLPLGAEGPADVTLDRLGAPRAAGGFSARLDDLARFAEMMRHGGRAADGTQVVPADWVADIHGGGDPEAWALGEMPYLYPGGSYRSQWYRTPEPSAAIAAMGIHGQWLWVDPAAEVTIVRLSSQAKPADDTFDLAFIPALGRVCAALASNAA